MPITPVFFTEEMTAKDHSSVSPSAGKPSLVVAEWEKLGLPIDIIRPDPCTREQLSRAHHPSYVDDVLDLNISNGFGDRNPNVAAALPWTSGAMLSAALHVLENGGRACAPVSGFHHAGYGSGGGFCTFNGLMVTALNLDVKRVGILDLDQHYGNGTDDIINKLNLDEYIHHIGWEGLIRKARALNIHARDYLRALPAIMEEFDDCDIILYQAGADPHVDDPFGGRCTTEELHLRDRLVFENTWKPLVWNLAGGYQVPVQKVINLHVTTMRLSCETSILDQI